MGHLEAIFKSVLAGDAPSTLTGVKAAIADGVSAETVLRQGLIPAMVEVGHLFESSEYFVPEMLVAA